MSTQSTYTVTGMTCGHCVGSVNEKVSCLPGVTGVDVDLVAGGASTLHVTGEAPLLVEQVREAVDEAGYQLTGASR